MKKEQVTTKSGKAYWRLTADEGMRLTEKETEEGFYSVVNVRSEDLCDLYKEVTQEYAEEKEKEREQPEEPENE